jgi:hypothetical protein
LALFASLSIIANYYLPLSGALCFSGDLLKYLRSIYKPPEKLLHAKFHKMEKIEVRVLLCRLLGSERRAHPAYGTKRLKPYFLRLKWKRIKVANHYEKIGGILDPQAKQWALPVGNKWPGTIALVKDRVQIKT